MVSGVLELFIQLLSHQCSCIKIVKSCLVFDLLQRKSPVCRETVLLLVEVKMFLKHGVLVYMPTPR